MGDWARSRDLEPRASHGLRGSHPVRGQVERIRSVVRHAGDGDRHTFEEPLEKRKAEAKQGEIDADRPATTIEFIDVSLLCARLLVACGVDSRIFKMFDSFDFEETCISEW